MVAVGSVVALVATWFGLPGLVAAWFATLAAAWSVQPPELTGVDAKRNPIASGPREAKALKRYNFARSLKWGLAIPHHAFWPGWPVKAAWVYGVATATAMFLVPHKSIDGAPTWLFNCVSAFFTLVLVAQFAAARRDSVETGDRSPGVDVSALRKLWSNPADNPLKSLPRWARFTFAGVGAVAGGLLGAFSFAPAFAAGGPVSEPVAVGAWTFLGALAGAGTVAAREWVRESLGHWRLVCAARKEWAPTWEMLKQVDAPQLLDREHVGAATIDTFRAAGSVGSATYFPLGDKILQARGAAQRLAILPVESRDPQGQPMPGTIDPLGFKIVAWPNDFSASLADPALDEDVAQLWLSCALAWACAAWGFQPSIDQMRVVSAPEAPERTWEVTLHMPNGPGYAELRKSIAGSIPGSIAAEVLVDHRPPAKTKKTGDAMYVGNLTGNPELAEGVDASAEDFNHLAAEDAWNVRWAAVLKQDVNPPTYNPGSASNETLVNGIEVQRQAFVTRNGVDPRDFFGLENKVKATLSGAPFVAITGWHNTSRPGERHNQAFAVYWSHRAVPTCPDKLAPPAPPGGPAGGPGRGRGPGDPPRRRGRDDREGTEAGPGRPARPQRPGAGRRSGPPPKLDAQQWVLAGVINDAFKAGRLARPELYKVRCLTEPTSRGHIWAMHVRLYDGVTLADVRGAMHRLRGDMGSEWLRVEEAPDGCTIVAGVHPNKAKIITEADEKWVVSLDWEQAFLDAKVVGVGGITPTLRKVDRIPNNDQVQVLDFDLPTGLAFSDVKGASKKLETASGNAFIDVRQHDSGRAGLFTMLVSEVNPMPASADVDFDVMDSANGIPFATGVEGEPVVFDPKDSPHALLAGVTGAGKSVLITNFVYGFLVRGADVYIIDPVKGGADFAWAKDRCKAFAGTPFEAAGVMKAVYAEVVRRKDMNSAAGVASYLDLPNPPRPIVVVLDEFTSLMGKSTVPAPSDDPETERERAYLIAENDAKAVIGTFTGKLAREARSAGVTVLLGTQKLTAKMLDSVPGGSDLKSLRLTERLPVPVSAKFPDGWAHVADLDEGDLLYAPDGATTRILGFTDVPAGEDVYEVTFDDGRSIVTGADHGWLASDHTSRRAFDRTLTGLPDEGRLRADRIAEYEGLRDTAAILPDDLYATAAELAVLLEWRDAAAITRFASGHDVARFQRDRTGHVQPQVLTSRRGSAPRLFSVDDALTVFAHRDGVDRLAARGGAWLTAREIAETIEARPITAARAGNYATRLKEAGCVSKESTHAETLYRAVEVTDLIVAHLAQRLGIDPRTGEPWQRERVLTTAEMSQRVWARDGREANWQITNAAPIAGPVADLPVDPYVLGAWLGDGSQASAMIMSGRTESCTDENGLTDQDHLIAQIRAAGHDAYALTCSDKTVSTRDLKVRLRDLGVLNNKHIPAVYLRASFDQRLALLQGLMDTDGSVMVSGTCSFSQVDQALAMQVRELVESLGIKVGYSTWPASYLPEGATEKKVTGTVHHLSFSTHLPAFRLPRKLAKQGSPTRRVTSRSIVAITKLPTEPTRCVAVDHPSHLFLTEGFIPTHNTNLARVLLGNASSGDRASAFRAPESAPIMTGGVPKGRGLWESLSSSAAVMVQTWYAPPTRLRDELVPRVPALDESEQLDMAQFGPPEMDVEGAIMPSDDVPTKRSRSKAPAAPKVIELDEISLSLDDLALDEADLDDAEVDVDLSSVKVIYEFDGADQPVPDSTEAGADEPGPDMSWLAEAEQLVVEQEAEASAASSEDPFADFSFDDALTPEPGAAPFADAPAVPAPEVSPVKVHENWADIDPTPWLVAESAYDWAEIDALEKFLAAFPQVKEVTWLDETLLMDNSMGVTFLELVEEIAEDRGVIFHGPTAPAPAPRPAPVTPTTVPVPPAPVPHTASAPAAPPAPAPAIAPAKLPPVGAPAPAAGRLADFDDDELAAPVTTVSYIGPDEEF